MVYFQWSCYSKNNADWQISKTVHATCFDILEDYRVMLWNTFSKCQNKYLITSKKNWFISFKLLFRNNVNNTLQGGFTENEKVKKY